MKMNLPDVFPLHEDKDFLTGREWVCLRLLCLNMKNLADILPEALSKSTNQQIELSRAQQIVNTAKIARLQGLGTWFSRLVVDAGFEYDDMIKQPAQAITSRINQHLGYPICNAKTAQSLQTLQQQW